MTGFEISRLVFEVEAVKEWSASSALHANWPVVYVLDSESEQSRPG